jgi:hypothetical protein
MVRSTSSSPSGKRPMPTGPHEVWITLPGLNTLAPMRSMTPWVLRNDRATIASLRTPFCEQKTGKPKEGLIHEDEMTATSLACSVLTTLLALPVFPHKIVIEADPQAWTLAEGQHPSCEPSALGIEVRPQRIALGIVERFDRQAIGHGRNEVAMDLWIVMRRHIYMVHAAHAGDFAPFGDSAIFGTIELHDVDGTLLQ